MRIVTVVTPATSEAFTTLATVKDALGITNTAQDTKITRLIEVVSREIERITGRRFPRETVTEKLPGPGTYYLVLERRPVVEVTQITFNGGVIPAEEYIVAPASGIVQRITCEWQDTSVIEPITDFRASFGATPDFQVDYTAGYLMPGEVDRDLPADLEEIAIDFIQASLVWKRRDPTLKSRSLGDASESYTDRSPAQNLEASLSTWLST